MTAENNTSSCDATAASTESFGTINVASETNSTQTDEMRETVEESCSLSQIQQFESDSSTNSQLGAESVIEVEALSAEKHLSSNNDSSAEVRGHSISISQHDM